MDEHICIPGEFDDNCIDCGKHMDLPDVGEPPDLGDIVGICKLIDETAAEVYRAIRANVDPKDPSQPRMRFVGNKIVRLSHRSVALNIISNHFKEAKAKGFRGNITRFAEHIHERMPSPANTLPR
jgi:hypothetical protein